MIYNKHSNLKTCLSGSGAGGRILPKVYVGVCDVNLETNYNYVTAAGPKSLHLHKDLRRATSLPMLLRKKSVPCKQSLQYQARVKTHTTANQNSSKTTPFGGRTPLYSLYKGIPPPHLPQNMSTSLN